MTALGWLLKSSELKLHVMKNCGKSENLGKELCQFEKKIWTSSGKRTQLGLIFQQSHNVGKGCKILLAKSSLVERKTMTEFMKSVVHDMT